MVTLGKRDGASAFPVRVCACTELIKKTATTENKRPIRCMTVSSENTGAIVVSAWSDVSDGGHVSREMGRSIGAIECCNQAITRFDRWSLSVTGIYRQLTKPWANPFRVLPSR